MCRKRASAAAAAAAVAAASGGGGGGGVSASSVGASIAGAAPNERVSDGLSRGDLGAIGVSDAGDDLGVSPGSGGPSKVRERCSWHRSICST